MTNLHVFETTREAMPSVRFGELFFDGATLDDLVAAERIAAAEAEDAERARRIAADRRIAWIIATVFTVAIGLVMFAVIA